MNAKTDLSKPDSRLGRIGFWLLIAAMVAAFFAVLWPMMHPGHGPRYLSNAIHNGKQLGQAMIIFDQDFGGFPSDEAADQMTSEGDFTSNFSNAYARQLIASGAIDTEMVGYIRDDQALYRKPDGSIKGNDAFAKGEFGWILVHAKKGNFGSASNPQLPILISGCVLQGRVTKSIP